MYISRLRPCARWECIWADFILYSCRSLGLIWLNIVVRRSLGSLWLIRVLVLSHMNKSWCKGMRHVSYVRVKQHARTLRERHTHFSWVDVSWVCAWMHCRCLLSVCLWSERVCCRCFLSVWYRCLLSVCLWVFECVANVSWMCAWVCCRCVLSVCLSVCVCVANVSWVCESVTDVLWVCVSECVSVSRKMSLDCVRECVADVFWLYVSECVSVYLSVCEFVANVPWMCAWVCWRYLFSVCPPKNGLIALRSATNGRVSPF